MATNWKQLKAIETKNKKRILEICPSANNESGIYVFLRYEGDIVKVTRSNNGYSPYTRTCVVQYNPRSASYDFYDYCGDIDSVEVIGNIFDNPELLRGSKK